MAKKKEKFSWVESLKVLGFMAGLLVLVVLFTTGISLLANWTAKVTSDDTQCFYKTVSPIAPGIELIETTNTDCPDAE